MHVGSLESLRYTLRGTELLLTVINCVYLLFLVNPAAMEKVYQETNKKNKSKMFVSDHHTLGQVRSRAGAGGGRGCDNVKSLSLTEKHGNELFVSTPCVDCLETFHKAQIVAQTLGHAI